MVKGPHPIDVIVGKRAKLRRLELGLSQEFVAKELRLTFQQLQKYENGSNRISASKLFEIAKTLKVSITYFFAEAIESDDEPSLLSDLKSEHAKDGLRLIKAFMDIEDAAVRRKAVLLIESISTPNKSK